MAVLKTNASKIDALKTRRSWRLSNVMMGIIGACSVALVSCGGGGESSESGDLPTVVTTTTILTDLTEEVAGEEVEVSGILKPGDDPHVYEPVPQDTVTLEGADLIIYNGYNLEPALIRMIEASGVEAKVPVAEAVPPLQMDYDGQQEPDPHVWGNVKNAIAMVEKIRDDLSEEFPEDAAVFQANAERAIAVLEKLDIWVAEQIATIPENQRKLVTTHDAFQYYAQAYELPVLGTLIGISTEEQPSAQTVKRLADLIRNAKVPSIFAETTINPALITTVAEEAGVELAPNELYADAIGEPGSRGDSYVNMIIANTETVVMALGGEFTPFNPDN